VEIVVNRKPQAIDVVKEQAIPSWLINVRPSNGTTAAEAHLSKAGVILHDR